MVMEIWNCNYCGKEIKVENRYSKSVHTRNCQEAKKIVDSILTKEFLEKEYIINGKSSYNIAIETGISNNKVRNKLIKFNIPLRNCKEAGQSEIVKKKRIKSTIKKYGAKNVLSKDSKVRETMETMLVEKYGVDTVFKLGEIQDKCKKTILDKYGGIGSSSETILNKMKETCLLNNGVEYGIHCIPRITKPHKLIIDYLKESNIVFEVEKKILNGKYRADIIIDNNKIIEINGDFFHANPDKFKPNDILNIFGNKLYASEIWVKDDERSKELEKNQFNILVLWENDIKNNLNKCKGEIWKFLK